MSVSVKSLRVWLLVGAGLLAAVIGAFLGYAHYRAHRFLAGLPRKLGVDIQREADGYTYSQSVQGKTVFTIHAAKAVQHRDGKTTLHDVDIILYGQGQGSPQRVDRIYGKEFEYDQSSEVIRATGEVHIDLQAPKPADTHAKMEEHDAKGVAIEDDERLIHLKTSGLVFMKKLGVAATDQDLEFEYRGMTGLAKGADYSSDTGVLVLQSAVRVNGVEQGQPVVVTASRAEMDRQSFEVLLSHAKYVMVVGAGNGRAGDGRTVEAEKATVHLRHDGSVEFLQAEGGVTLGMGDGTTVTGSRGEVRVSAQNKPQSAVLLGAVRLVADGPLRQARGEAEEVKAAFDKAGRLHQVVMTGGVHLHERARTADAVVANVVTERWSDRDLVARRVDLALVRDSARRVQLRDAKAEGDARLTVVNPAVAAAKSGHKGATSSALSADVLTAAFVTRDGASLVKDVHGVGRTLLRRGSDTGAMETSAGDTLDVEFRVDGGGSVRSGGGGAARNAGKDLKSGHKADKKSVGGQGEAMEEITTAVQQGHVVMTSEVGEKAGVKNGDATGGARRATADRAAYDGSTEKVTLTGTVELSEAGSVLWADRVLMEQQTGDAVAEGSVKVSYQQAGSGGETVHVLATRAELKHEAGVAIFYGVGGRPARMWQGASQVEAPVLELAEKQKRMVARGEGQGAAMAVHAVFVSAGPMVGAGSATDQAGTKPDQAGTKTVGRKQVETKSGGTKVAGARQSSTKGAGVVRVASREMIYSDDAKRADFTGGVLVQSADGTMHGRAATVFLQAVAGDGNGRSKVNSSDVKGVGQTAFLGGSVDRLLATGGIVIEQPGRRALGEQVVYTTVDGMFVMTGRPGNLPRMIDDTRGTITGASLRFHAGDNSVVVSNGTDRAAGERVRTETEVKQ